MKAATFSREQLAASQTYAESKDLLLAVLEKEKMYTKEEAEAAMTAYRKRGTERKGK